MSTPLLQGATGQPVKTVWRFAPQTSRTIPAITGFVDARTNGGGPGMSPSTVKRMLLNPSTEPLQELDGKLVFSPDPIDFGDISVTNKGFLYSLLNWYGKYAIADNTTYYTWTLGRDQATSFADYVTLIGDNDIIPRTRWKDGLAKTITMTAKAGGNFQGTAAFLVGSMDMFGDPTQTTGTGAALPILAGYYANQMSSLDATDKNVVIKIITGASNLIKSRLGAGSYTGATYAFALDTYSPLTDEADLPIGKWADQVNALFVTGVGTLTDNDVYTIPKRRAAWTPSYATDQPLPSINVKMSLNGVTTRMEGGITIKYDRPGAQAVPDVFGRQSATVRDTGQREVEITVAREVLDLDLQAALINGSPVAFDVDAKVDTVIGSSVTKFYRQVQSFPACKLSGNPVFQTKPGGTDRGETFVLKARVPDSAHTYDGVSYSNAANMTLYSNQSAL